MQEKTRAITFISSQTTEAQAARQRLVSIFGDTPPEEAEVIVALGGDGLMLQTLHQFMHTGIPIYGMNCGSVGFLMNDYSEENLIERLNTADETIIHPLIMTATDVNGNVKEAKALNEVSLWRQTYQAAKLRISVDNKIRLKELICDGALVSTPAGSTAYNLSAHGPIIPINASLLALTPISPFRPRRWKGALLPSHAHVTFDIIEPEKRPVSVSADHDEFRNVKKVQIHENKNIFSLILFDEERGFDERILAEQFEY
jgi:NAD+ kinase